jgi:hypothetical protein
MRVEERSIFTTLPIPKTSRITDDTISQASIRRSQRPHSSSILSPIPCQICVLNTNTGKFTKCQHEVYCSSCAELFLRKCLKEGKKPKCGFINCSASAIDEEGLFKDFNEELKK